MDPTLKEIPEMPTWEIQYSLRGKKKKKGNGNVQRCEIYCQ